jgi:xanthine dehydrogenase accessory factor
MNKQISTWRFIRKSLHNQVPVMLLYVLESSGSSPGRQGFFMAVDAKGDMKGSIGGGMMEHKFVELAKDILKRNEREFSLRKQVHDKSAAQNQSGMICSGEQTNFLYTVSPDDAEDIEGIISCLENNKTGLLTLSPAGLYFDEHDIPSNDYTFKFKSEEYWLYQERIGFTNHLYIIGGGHCALALSRIMRMMDFYIHLFDDRHPLNTFLDNHYVHEKTVVNNYSQLKDIIPSGDHNYVVVMTFGYRTDDVVIRSLFKKQFKYFGVLGSSKKIDKMFKDYDEEGIDANKFKRIYAPIGLPIKSQTPEEIAVSIAAEIIQVKNSKENLC